MCVFCFVLMPLNDLVEHFVSTDSKLDLHKKSITSAIFIAVVLAPVFEEIGFRLILRRNFPIKYIFSQKLWDKIFPFLVYASSVIFGFGHLTNYTNDGFWFYVFSPIIIAPQLIGGLVTAFIRVKYNFFYGILYHSLWNASLIFPLIFINNFSSHTKRKQKNTAQKFLKNTFLMKIKSRFLKQTAFKGKFIKQKWSSILFSIFWIHFIKETNTK